MRTAFAETVSELGARDERILLLTGDLGYKALEPFSERFPDRFFNVGVAEQNMVGLATGLAECGFLPFVYSIATFASLRAYEFVRNGPVAHRLPVRIVGVGGGFEYGPAGSTHHGLEDIGVMRLQPELTVLAPADPEQTRTMVADTWELDGPIYYRIGKDDRTMVPGLEGRFELGRSQVVREGNELLLLAMGNLAAGAVEAAEVLASDGLSCQVAVVSTLSPTPFQDLERRLSGFDRALTVESHYVTGGLGTLVSETIAEAGLACRLRRLGVREGSWGVTGSQAFLRDRHGLSRSAIVRAAKELASG
jgi:transketolase